MEDSRKQRNARGLILIQIDGLARFHLERALNTGRMPFLENLLTRRDYRIHPLYSGVPSTTPAIQGELLYGVKAIVPAFSFREHQSNKIFRMYDPEAAVTVENRLQRHGSGLLEDGSSYSGIFAGGAEHHHFCTVSFGKKHLFRNIRLANWPITVLAYLKTLVKSVLLMGFEAFLALVDLFRGIVTGKNFFKELKFIASRMAITILLRDLVKASAVLDIKNGVPIIFMNFLGYDEHAHRRGPSSGFAYWTLKGIDAAVKEIWNAARQSKQRAYDMWLFSDHGQEDTASFGVETGRDLQEAVNDVLAEPQAPPRRQTAAGHQGIQSLRSSLLGGRFLPKLLVSLTHPSGEPEGPTIAAMGPLGHIYLPREPASEERMRLGRMLAEKAGIPLVLTVDRAGRVIAWTESGQFHLPDQAADILGRDHPYREAAAQDLIGLCRHPDAGTFVISGWRPHDKPLSFPIERGAHGGPGRHETDAFALLPPDTGMAFDAGHKRGFMRIADLREAVINFRK